MPSKRREPLEDKGECVPSKRREPLTQQRSAKYQKIIFLGKAILGSLSGRKPCEFYPDRYQINLHFN